MRLFIVCKNRRQENFQRLVNFQKNSHFTSSGPLSCLPFSWNHRFSATIREDFPREKMPVTIRALIVLGNCPEKAPYRAPGRKTHNYCCEHTVPALTPTRPSQYQNTENMAQRWEQPCNKYYEEFTKEELRLECETCGHFGGRHNRQPRGKNLSSLCHVVTFSRIVDHSFASTSISLIYYVFIRVYVLLFLFSMFLLCFMACLLNPTLFLRFASLCRKCAKKIHREF
jgi:hypothetical protein